jgi:pimeloyl-ACP methyl ester carboxylesterase
MNEQFADLGDVTLCYETFGDPADPALLLVMGLATQMVAWREDFCRMLVERGFHVIRFDNRDVGRSSSMKGKPPGLGEMITRRIANPSYTLDDMADDAAGLLDHLGIEHAHVVGASMGAMIGQHLAVRHPEKVLSLVSIMAGTGHRVVGQPKLSIMPLFLSRAPSGDKQAYVERGLKLFRAIGSKTHFDEQGVREIAELSYDRGVNLAGTGRQLAAIIAAGNRTSVLKRIQAPTLVIQGKDDKLATPSGGKATARAIPGAQLLMLEGMGHDLPRPLWPTFVDAIVKTAGRVTNATPDPQPVLNPQAGV